MDGRGLARPLQHLAVGQPLFRGQRARQPRRPARRPRRRRRRPQGAGGRGPPPRHRAAAADPLLARSSSRASSSSTRLSGAPSANTATRASYRGVFPIKVNQERYVVEKLVEAGKPYHFGLEAGSKPELLAVMAMLDDEDALIICNGYKDEEYVETALLASKLGRHVILVVEKFSELPLIAQVAASGPASSRRSACAPGCRRAAPATGRLRAATARSSGSARAGCRRRSSSCEENDLLDRLELLHFHLGSQISSIRNVKEALREAGRTYCELAKLGAPLGYLDVGGGLGIDYDGSQTNFSSSMNYSMQEYANDIVFGVMELCDAGRHSPPDAGLRSRAARWWRTTRCWSSTCSASASSRVGPPPETLPEGTPPPVRYLLDTLPRGLAQEPARGLPRRGRVPRRDPLAVQPRPPVAHRARARRGPLLGAGAQDPAPGARVQRGARGARGAGAPARRHLLLQLLDLPVAARLVGDRPALPDRADPPPQRGADSPRRARRHHLRLRRQDRPLHRPPRRQARARAPPARRATTTTSASSSSAPTRRSSATCTTCSATPTRCTSRSPRAAATTSTTC